MLRIATIGTSMITDDFIQVVNANDQAAFVGTLSRDANRGTAFTAERGGERNFTSLDELAVAADVDAVYIGSHSVCACLTGVFYYFLQLVVRKAHTRYLRDIEIWIKR